MLSDSHWEKFCQALELEHASDPSLTRLRQRKKTRERVEELVRQAVRGRHLDDAAQRLKAAGMGCSEVLPLERVLDAAQARAPGKLRRVQFRGLEFEVPEFPWTPRTATPPEGLPPPELGAHTQQLLADSGVPQEARAQVQAHGPASEFAWAPVRREG
jgi:crotonobetainyl-CoA:carnitine CoA-transferase CaiB-like acyl-CoA transferase